MAEEKVNGFCDTPVLFVINVCVLCVCVLPEILVVVVSCETTVLRTPSI